MATHKVEIQAIPPVAFAVPGIRKVRTGDTIEIHNSTGGQVKIYTADKGVLKGMGKLAPRVVNNGKTGSFEVEATDGTHELAVHYRYKDKKKNNKIRTGFAIGASSPKIIIVR